MNNITNWVFDLDNTLYKAECGLFDKVHILMGKFIEEKLNLNSGDAQALRSKYYHQYGTTLRGLMIEHQVNPDEYLDLSACASPEFKFNFSSINLPISMCTLSNKPHSAL